MVEDEWKFNLAKAFDIPQSLLTIILKNKKEISEGEFPNLEECVIEWEKKCRGPNSTVGAFLLNKRLKHSSKK